MGLEYRNSADHTGEWDYGWYRKAGCGIKKSHKVFGNQ